MDANGSSSVVVVVCLCVSNSTHSCWQGERIFGGVDFGGDFVMHALRTECLHSDDSYVRMIMEFLHAIYFTRSNIRYSLIFPLSASRYTLSFLSITPSDTANGSSDPTQRWVRLDVSAKCAKPVQFMCVCVCVCVCVSVCVRVWPDGGALLEELSDGRQDVSGDVEIACTYIYIYVCVCVIKCLCVRAGHVVAWFVGTLSSVRLMEGWFSLPFSSLYPHARPHA